ncbi:MerR family transcriptional regulator [Kribbella sp. NPDC049227]|uniref:MerR family transcriptional regulator n=1 Tax=Kribbella sp. NPDC049227 TaxID=3364113 RepID=UPI003721CFF6
MPDPGADEPKSLRLHSKQYLRPIDLARLAGLGVTQIRTYEKVGFLPPAERGPNGYRRYTDVHVEALRVARIVIAGYGWQPALDVMRAIHAGDRTAVLDLVNASHGALDHQRVRTQAALDAIESALRPTTSQLRTRRLRIAEAAAIAGVRPSAVRFWEQQGLLQPEREASTAYRVYSPEQLRRLTVIALLRDVGQPFDVIRDVLDELSQGRPDQVRRALHERLDILEDRTWRCIGATAAIRHYLTN